MAEYQLTPYVVHVYPARDRSSPLKMGRVSPGTKDLSVLDALAKTFTVLSREESPRRKSRDRDLQVRAVKRTQTQLEVTCSLGVRGYVSRLNLKALGVSADRGPGDTEWFDLRVLFAALPTARAGLLLVEGVGNFGIVSHTSGLIKSGIRANVPNVTFEIKPVQDAQAWAETLAALSTQALEFHTLVRTGDIADEAATGGEALPLTKVVKISRRGGLGSFANIAGRDVAQIAAMFGVGHDIDADTWAIATLGSGPRKRKINVKENRVSSISFPIPRKSLLKAPTDAEFYAVANQIVQDVRLGTGLGNLNVSALTQAGTRNIEPIDTANWTVPDEAASEAGPDSPSEDAQG